MPVNALICRECACLEVKVVSTPYEAPVVKCPECKHRGPPAIAPFKNKEALFS